MWIYELSLASTWDRGAKEAIGPGPRKFWGPKKFLKFTLDNMALDAEPKKRHEGKKGTKK